ncbi:hypothetical protein FG379_001830 [Cryptosporidium bovis]|uniref:uncharacterized protein n=1 Tax=Cryptosporidium bovis TaxID=310047 RepID=UPI00351A7BE4|nr:hypothetical protein FG379_001830 [Cryptosporidium bovis]
MSVETKYSPDKKSLFGGIHNCIVYPVVNKDFVSNNNKYKDEIAHFDAPIFVSPINKSVYLSKIYLLLCISTFGIFSVFCYWFPNVFRIMNYSASTIDECEYFLLVTNDSYYIVVEKKKFSSLEPSNYEINLLNIFNFSPSGHISKNNDGGVKITFFVFCGSLYQFDSVENSFVLTRPSLDNATYAEIRNNISILLNRSKEACNTIIDSSDNESSSNNRGNCDNIYPLIRSNLQYLFGKCSCEIRILTILDLIQHEIFHPFFIFQISAIIIWVNSSYMEYAICIIIITFFTLLSSVYETRSSHIKMREMSKLNIKVSVISIDSDLTEPSEEIIDSTELIPGDLILIEPGMTLPCDAILLSSEAILNEAALSGESVPVIKTPIPRYSNGTFLFEKDQKHILFSRTVVIGINGNKYGLALVLRTGFSTLQGLLYQSMYSDIISNRIHFQNDRLYKDSMKFVKLCFIIGIIGCILTGIFGYLISVDSVTIFFKSIDLFTIVVPPALPATIAAGCNIAIMKLKKKKISCSNPSSINISGQINTVVFDKTGTLTTDGLDVIGCISFVGNNDNGPDKNNVKLITNSNDVPSTLSKALATCHSITYIDRDNTAKIGSSYSNHCNFDHYNAQRIPVGEPLEMCMLNFSGWKLQDKDSSYDHSFNSVDNYISSYSDNSPVSTCGNNNNNNSECDNYLDIIINTKTKSNFREISSTRVVRKYPNNCNNGDKNNFNSNKKNSDYEELEIIKVFEFCSKLRRMTVLCRNPNKPTEIMIFCKGSPEQIKNICSQNTVPTNLEDHILSYSRIGMRIIGFAFGYFDVPSNATSCFLEELSRNQIEDKLSYIGLMIFANKLRSNSINVISTLKNANINCVISTGDHTNTAISVANECGIISNSETNNNEPKIYVIGDIFTNKDLNDEMNKSIKWTLLTKEFDKINEFSSIQEVLINYNFENIHWVVTGQCLRFLHELHYRFGLEFLDLSNKPVEDPNKTCTKSSRKRCLLETFKNTYYYLCNYLNLNNYICNNSCISRVCNSNINDDNNGNYSISSDKSGKDRNSGYAFNKRLTNSLPKWILLDSISRTNIYCDSDRVLLNNGMEFNEEEYIGLNNIPFNLNCTRNQINSTNDIPLNSNFVGDIFNGRNNNELAYFEKKMILKFDAKFNDIPFSIKMSALEFITRYCHVYCRMTPTDKALHIFNLQKLNPKTYVGMCGDGNNDILAIQSADIGISIADHDETVPSAFISSVDRNIDAVPDILLEGRAALTSTIQSFQYIVMYIFIQFTSVLFLYSKGTNFTDHQFIWSDLITFLPISIFATFTGTNKRLPSKFPVYTNILSNNVLIGIFMQCVVQLFFLVMNNYIVSKQEGFVPYLFTGQSIGGERKPEHLVCIENTVTFLTTCIQYLSTGLAMHRTKPFRLALSTNILFSVHSLFLFLSTIYILFNQGSQLSKILNVVYLPGKINYILLSTFIINITVSFVVMKIIIKKLYRREVKENGPTFFPQLYPLIVPNRKIEWKISHYSSI